ncbi:glycosyltransferase family 1 protein [Streptomyces aidingensis]|uniref:D-inositol 3-phosphate glycosyltransferase n=1 Tax=Streptomyces aidingensis TaxID=910347 RepID=A0A1I1PHL0_9ACTN|nr:glycosyltransferase family 1 protein [Streptomyces aidingensis]SFD07178.1 Glycosyltransferase involved in cell wall bisynthesis [Streptomyces aidingensis]
MTSTSPAGPASRPDSPYPYRTGNGAPDALVYGDVDLNLLDGSAIWAQAMMQALSLAGCRGRLLLKAPVRTGRLTDPIAALPGITVLPGPSPHENPLSPRRASGRLVRLDEEDPCDLLVLRGRRLVEQVVADGRFDGRIWAYLTDIPQSAAEMTPGDAEALGRIARAARHLLCQTEEMRCFLETWVPDACGKCVLYPPSVPAPGPGTGTDTGSDTGTGTGPREAAGDPVRLVYTGKFAPQWNTLEMTGLPAELAARGVRAELHTVGDKIHRVPDDPDYHDRMARALHTAPGVVHHGGMGREDAMRTAAGCHIGLGWRRPELDASLELSTKVLEFGSLGLPVLLNRTPAHETLLGADYPLFVPGRGLTADAAGALAHAVRSPEVYRTAAARCRRAAAGFTLERAAQRLRALLDRAFPPPPAALRGRPRPLRIGVAGHDLKFLDKLLDAVRALPGTEIRVDDWPALSRHDPRRSRELAGWADVVLVEWCGPAAVWYSRHKRPGSRLLVRLHRFELYADWPRQVDIDAVDRVICVSPHYTALALERTGWPPEKLVTVPNWVDAGQLDRAKTADARFRLGMIGIAPARKRLDLGIEVLAALRARDPRWQLSVKSKMPWDYWWIWNKPEERDAYDPVLRRIQGDPLLDGAVVFDEFGPDVASWLRRIGFVLSVSDDESFHLSPAEGMASGAVPALLPWPGSDAIYDRRWIHDSPAAMAEAIAALAEDGWERAGALARRQVREAYSLETVAAAWTGLLTAGAGRAPAPV